MNSAALFQILFQNETLFQLHEARPENEVVHEKAVIIEENIKPVVIAAPPIITSTATAVILEKPVVIITPEKPVEIPLPAKSEIIKAAPPIEKFPVLQHKILILIDEPKQKEMLVSEALFLDNILKAVKSSTDNADIINFSFLPKSDARSVLAEKRTNYFITFGVPLAKLHLDLLLIPYTPKMVEGIWFLLTDPLVVIEAERDLKKKLWLALQKMFETSN